MPNYRLNAPFVDLFKADEERVLAEWLGVAHPVSDSSTAEVLGNLGVPKEVGWYQRTDAAVAQILLESVQPRLPNCWISTSGLTRNISDRLACRKVELLPQHLFTINWADSGPGLCWPVEYYVTYVPGFDRMVVTASADCSDAFGVCDIAIGSFKPDDAIIERQPPHHHFRLVLAAEAVGPGAMGLPVRYRACFGNRGKCLAGRGLA